MSIEQYLNNILKDEELRPEDCNKIDKVESAIRSILQKKFPKAKILPTGSKIKKTAIRSGYDFDLLVVFPKDYKSPKEISEDVYNALKEHKKICCQKNKVSYTYKAEPTFHMDIVPCQEIDTNFFNLYNQRDERPMRTSRKLHLDSVKGIQREIRLMKVWKKQVQLPLKTFVLERVVMKAMKAHKPHSLYVNLSAIFRYVQHCIEKLSITDEANSNNDIEKYLDNQRKHMQKLALKALDILQNEDSFSRRCQELFGKPYSFKDKQWKN